MEVREVMTPDPMIDGEGRCIGIVSQADLALRDTPEIVSKTVAAISRPHSVAA